MQTIDAVLNPKSVHQDIPAYVRKALRLPEGNHIVAPVGDVAQRVTIDRAFAQLAWDTANLSAGLDMQAPLDLQESNTYAQRLALEWFPLPYRHCWIEFEGPSTTTEPSALYLNLQHRRLDAFTSFRADNGLLIHRFLSAELELFEGLARINAIRLRDNALECRIREVHPANSVLSLVGLQIATLQFLTDQTMFTIRHIGGDRRRSAARLIGSAHSAPVYSHNRFEMCLPMEATVCNGEVVLTQSANGVRRHEVCGYRSRRGKNKQWKFIPAHSRGNEALGWVTKTKKVKAA